MSVCGSLIYGNDDESDVFAPVSTDDEDLTILCRFSMNSKRPRSLPSRIVACFHDIVCAEAEETFPDRSTMREALYSSIQQVLCKDHWITQHPQLRSPEVAVEIYEDAAGQLQWRIGHEISSYRQYLPTLKPVGNVLKNAEEEEDHCNVIGYQSLAFVEYLSGGRGKSALVRIRNSLSSSGDNLFVYKGLDFGTWLESRRDFPAIRDVFYHEVKTINSLPPHPNIVPSPRFYVLAGKAGGGHHNGKNNDKNKKNQDCLCGILHPFMKLGSLNDHIEQSNPTRLDLRTKARWCLQMSSALHHTHHIARTYHMDIKPANFLLEDTNNDLILIDWEQSGAAPCTLAPEADGSWDLKSDVQQIPVPSVASSESSRQDDDQQPTMPALSSSSSQRLVYEKYTGPPRKNLPFGRPEWNVFPLWRDTCPRALEAAEIYTLGRTMWMMLEQVGQSTVEDAGGDVVVSAWTAEDVPSDWTEVVDRCLELDPNERVRLEELVGFWEGVVLCRDGSEVGEVD
ncbi:MAG: hypothetical protein M1831_006354 [Alyxoria varia]|nr:MAG: hypothetical protein M1831_006354 [Alyxoria varia]